MSTIIFLLFIMLIIIITKLNSIKKQGNYLDNKIDSLSNLIKIKFENLTTQEKKLKKEKPKSIYEEKTIDNVKTKIQYFREQNKSDSIIDSKFDELNKKNKPEEKTINPIPSIAETKVPTEKNEADLIYEAYEAKQQNKENSNSKSKQTEFYKNVKIILKKIWNWILVGEEFRSPDMSIEYAVASTWLMRVGIIAITLCIGYFLIWSMDRGMLGPMGRISFSIIAGLTMIIFGIKNLKGKYSILGQGFVGGGLAALYFSMYACGPLYNKIPIPAVFVLMILITISSGIISVKWNSQLIAIFGIIGGFITPILLRTGSANFLALYSYMLILGIGILGISRIKNWPLLNYLGFIFTWGIVFGSIASAYQSNKHFIIVITGISLFFILHSVIVYIYNLLKKEACSLLEIIHMLLNSFIYSGLSFALINEAYGEQWASIMTISLAVFYIAHIYIFLKKKFFDRTLLICLISLASLFTVWTIPLLTNNSTLTVVWSLQALAILWIGIKLKSNFMISISQILYIIVLTRMFIFEIPEQFNGINLSNLEFSGYLKLLLKRLINFGFVIGSFFCSSYITLKNQTFFDDLAINKNQDIPKIISRKNSSNILYWIAILISFIYFNYELYHCLHFYKPLRQPVLTITWFLLGILFLTHFLKNKNHLFLNLILTVTIIIFLKLIVFDFVSWNFHNGIFNESPINILMRIIDFIPLLLLLFLLINITKEKQFQFNYTLYGIIAANIILFIYFTFEINTLCHWYLPDFKQGALSLVWAIFAITYLMLGLIKNSKNLRYTGLILFIIVIIKIFIVDLAHLIALYRVLAFMVLGIILIAGSFMYIKSSKKFLIKEGNND